MSKSQNIALNFIYATITVGDAKQEYTFVTKEKNFQHSLESSINKDSVIPVEISITRQLEYTIGSQKEKVFHTLCDSLLKNVSYLRYEGSLPYDADSNAPSFKKNILFDADEYLPTTPLEQFLSSHNIFKSYYKNHVNFLIKTIRSEYSKEFGQREFVSSHTSSRITEDILTGKITEAKSSYLYTSNVKQKIESIIGVDDDGKKINIKMAELAKLN